MPLVRVFQAFSDQALIFSRSRVRCIVTNHRASAIECGPLIDDQLWAADIAPHSTCWEDFNTPLTLNVSENPAMNFQFSGLDVRVYNGMLTDHQNVACRDRAMKAPINAQSA
jgi:hypothetical protein